MFLNSLNKQKSSYLNVILRYLGPWDLGTYSPPLVWFGYGGEGVSCNIWEWDWRWTIDLYIDLIKLWGGWVEPWDLLLPSTFYSSNLLPPPCYFSQLLHLPPKPPANSSYLLPKDLRWLISWYMKRLKCKSAQKSFLGGWVDLDPSLTTYDELTILIWWILQIGLILRGWGVLMTDRQMDICNSRVAFVTEIALKIYIVYVRYSIWIIPLLY